MKRILLFAFLMLVVSVNAQTKYNSLSEEQKQEMINSIISETGKSFVLDEEDKKGNKFYSYLKNILFMLSLHQSKKGCKNERTRNCEKTCREIWQSKKSR